MRNIRIVAVGKIKQSAKYLQEGIALYQKRLNPTCRVEWVELPEENASTAMPAAVVLEKETEAILKHCTMADRIVLLDEKGVLLNSQEFAAWLFNGNPLDGGRGQAEWTRMIFIIGGANGTSETLKKAATDVISLSPLTFPHQMVRLILIEQLYRAVTIHQNHPYHK